MISFAMLLALYFGMVVGYGITSLFRDDTGRDIRERLNGGEAALFALIVGLGWPYFLTQHVRRNIEARKERKRQIIAAAAERERQAAIKAKADAAEESWRYMNDEQAKKTRAKRAKYAAEHSEWNSLEKQALELYYRRLNYSGIREARAKAKGQGLAEQGSMLSNMLDRLLDDKILEATNNVDFLNSLEPDERQKVVARAQEIERERYDKMIDQTFGRFGGYHEKEGGYWYYGDNGKRRWVGY